MEQILMLLAAAAVLVSYQADVRPAPGAAEVSVRVEIAGLQRDAIIGHTLFLYPDQQVGEIHAPTPLSTRRDGRLLRIELSAAGERAAYMLRYTVRGGERIPLPVPDALPSPRERPVRLAVVPAHGSRIAGAAFPPLDGEGRAWLSGVPAFMRVSLRPGGQVMWFDRISTASTLTDATILGLIALGSLLWFRRRGGM